MIARRMMILCCVAWSWELSAGHNAALGIDGTPNWVQSQVATVAPGFAITSPDFAFNHHGTASVSWSASQGAFGTGTVFRSEMSGLGLWSHNTIASGTGFGLRTSLAFDRAERPTVAWIDADGSVRVQFDDGAIQPVVGAVADVSRPALSISFDLAGDLRGAFSASVPGNLFDITESGGSYSGSSITTLPGVGAVSDLGLTTDYAGLRHVIARADLASSQAVMIASEPSFGGDWPSAVLAAADAVNGVAIATDPTDGNVALAYTTFDAASNTATLNYAKSNGFMLITTPVLTSTTDVFHDVDLAFDFADGRPAIAFEREVGATAAEELLLAFLDAGLQWQTSLVDGSILLDSPLGTVRRPSLAFDDFGTSFPAIAYVDADESLVVAFDPPAPEPATAAMLMLVLLLGPHRRRVWR